MNAERGDVDELPSSEAEWLAREGPVKSVPKAERSHGTRTTAAPSLKTDVNHGIPRYMRTLVTGPIATPLFDSEGNRAHKYPLTSVRPERMGAHFGDQWYVWSEASKPGDPREQVPDHFFSSHPESGAARVL